MAIKDVFAGEDFIPDCKASEGSTEGRVVLTCSPKLRKGDKMLKSERPVKIIVEKGEKASIEDDGGCSTDVMSRLMKYVEKMRMG